MQAIGIAVAVAVGVGAGALGWWFRASGLAARWACAGDEASRYGSQTLPPAIWPISAGVSVFVVLAALLSSHLGRFTGGGFAPWAVASLVVWAFGLALLGLVDGEEMVLPTKLLHICLLATVTLVITGCAATGEWHYLWQGALCAVFAGFVFAAWSLLRPGGLGFGDVRMAVLVAFGAGLCSPAGGFVALACAPLLAGAISNVLSRTGKTVTPKPVALGPFLAVGGIAVVVASAI